jgi:hypothetical protein
MNEVCISSYYDCWDELALSVVVYVILRICSLAKVMNQGEPTPTLAPSCFSEAR